MNKAEKERLERRKRMLAREQGHTSTKPVPGTSGDIGLRTPQPVHRTEPGAEPPPAKTQTTSNLKSLTPLLKQRQRRRNIFVAVVIVFVALGIGSITPPMAMCLFVTARLCKVTVADMIRPLLPFVFFVGMPVLLLVTYVPALSEWLPRIAGLI